MKAQIITSCEILSIIAIGLIGWNLYETVGIDKVVSSMSVKQDVTQTAVSDNELRLRTLEQERQRVELNGNVHPTAQ
jgi:hypothetical protein